jgi:ElaB/YqjD/DUF883 family membrane-anchored ribosome-binding protein
MSKIDFSELIVSKKGVVLSDRKVVGNIIGETEDSIVVEKDTVSENVYTIPKSNIEGYDGAQLILKSTESDLKAFEQQRESHGESVLEVITEKLGDVKDKVVDTTKGVANKTKDTIESIPNQHKQQSSGVDRTYEEGQAGTDVNRSDDPLTEYREKEAMTPAKINAGEPTAVQRDQSDQTITSGSPSRVVTQDVQEGYRKRQMTQVDSDDRTPVGSSVNQSGMDSVEVDSGRNSDENSTNVKATFSCETCGQTFNSRQQLKEHSSNIHYK